MKPLGSHLSNVSIKDLYDVVGIGTRDIRYSIDIAPLPHYGGVNMKSSWPSYENFSPANPAKSLYSLLLSVFTPITINVSA